MPIYTSFDEHGRLRDREMTMEARIEELTRANQIHIDDVYEAIALLRRVQYSRDEKDRGMGWVEEAWLKDRDTFLAKMAGPQR